MTNAERLFRWQWTIFALSWLVYAVVYFGRVNLSVALPDIQEELQVSLTQIGIISTAFFWMYAIGKLINGIIADKISTKWFVFVGIFIAGISNIWFSVTHSLVLMIFIWSLNAYAQSGLWGSISTMLTSWFSYRQKAFIAVILSTSMVGGYILGWGLSGQLVVHSGWSTAFWVPGVVIVIVSIIWLFISKDHPQQIQLQSPNLYRQEAQRSDQIRTPLIKLIKKTKLSYIAIGGVAQGVVKDGIAIWAPIYLMQMHNLNLAEASWYVLFIPIMNFFGILASGYINKLAKGNEKISSIILLVIGLLSLFGLLWVGSINLYGGLLFLGVCSAAMFGANTIIMGVIPMAYSKYNAVSSVSGYLDFCAYLATGVAFVITGWLVDQFGWDIMINLWIGITVLGIMALFRNYQYERRIMKG
ncbi:MAG: MFS transporter [Candidatus Pristimantibacillus lignocellulolyticus]|uniref:MFS transporter n=1 Tax=Candidatus Pristimantibacillus lignocellulolyticus TaxID=2994561 RepID=A0A9J6ZET9_9BACL|nr:MAG: MFS transporter [Candidatus Pristimantibacillus lignocellulolyticus]